MSVLFLSSDLVFSSRLAAAGKRMGVCVDSVTSIEAVEERVESNSVDLVICDLSAPGADPNALVARLRQRWPSLAIVAFAPHVHEDRLRAATEAGCNEVLSRGQFDRQMGDILARYAKKE
jgi:DNA-binding NarL/FixJ family response regulator